MKRSVFARMLISATGLPAILAAQQPRSRPDLIAPQVRDSAARGHAQRLRAERINADVPVLNLWSPATDRFDRMDFATVYFSVDRDAYVAAFEVGTDGRVRVIYPRSPRDPLSVRGGEMKRVLAGSGFYPESPFANQIPYVFVLASYRPFDLSKFGSGRRWQYQLASGGARSKFPEHTIQAVSEMVFDTPDAEVAADYLYFATRAQYRRAAAFAALDACGGRFWNGLALSEIGTDHFFQNYLLPMWDLYVPFSSFGGWAYTPVSSCSPRYYSPVRQRFASTTRGLAPVSPPDTVSPLVPGAAPKRTDGESGPKDVDPTREPRRRKVADGEETRLVAARLDDAPPEISAEKYGIGREKLSERRDREFTRERRALERAERQDRMAGAQAGRTYPDRWETNDRRVTPRSRPARAETPRPSTASADAAPARASAPPRESAPARESAPSTSSNGGRSEGARSPRTPKDPH